VAARALLPGKPSPIVLDSLGRKDEAADAMKKALPFANIFQVYIYANDLVNQKKTDEAFALFKMNYDKEPNNLYTTIGMASGYSAKGDYKTALGYAQKALTFATGPNVAIVNLAITDLQKGRDMNLD
jgi:tetratricopeptide (TPR) repeat protein